MDAGSQVADAAAGAYDSETGQAIVSGAGQAAEGLGEGISQAGSMGPGR